MIEDQVWKLIIHLPCLFWGGGRRVKIIYHYKNVYKKNSCFCPSLTGRLLEEETCWS